MGIWSEGLVVEENPKLQITNPKQIPSSKFQIPGLKFEV
jgi:hypothetical protein